MSLQSRHFMLLSKLESNMFQQMSLTFQNYMRGKMLVTLSCITGEIRSVQNFADVKTNGFRSMHPTVRHYVQTPGGSLTKGHFVEIKKCLPFINAYPIGELQFGTVQSRLSASCFSSEPHKTTSASESEKIRKEDISTDAKLCAVEQEYKKLSLVQRYKKMLKEYWYVLIPVHIATSLVWFGSFYYLAKSGIDIVPYLEALGVSEVILRPLRNSELGYLAVASAMYKIATPARYMVTLGGTTLAIKYLSRRGILKPMPSKNQLKSMINKKLSSSKDRTGS